MFCNIREAGQEKGGDYMKKSARKEVTEGARFMTPAQACERYGLCRNSVMTYARRADCVYKFGKSARIKVAVMDEFMENLK